MPRQQQSSKSAQPSSHGTRSTTRGHRDTTNAHASPPPPQPEGTDENLKWFYSDYNTITGQEFAPPPSQAATVTPSLSSQPPASFLASSQSLSIPAPPSPARTSQSTVSTSVSGRGGRRAGTHNWTDEELDLFFRLAKEVLPMGSTGWATLAAAYNEAASQLQLPARDVGQLRRKLSKLVKEAGGKKPTGKSKKSRRLSGAYEVDWAIRQQYGCGVLDDSATQPTSDDDEADEEEDGEEDETQTTSSQRPSSWHVEKAYKSRALQGQPTRPHNGTTLQAISNISSAFDPEHLRLRDEHRAEQNALLIQLNSSQAEIRRLQTDVDRLREELLTERLRAQRAEDRLEMEREMGRKLQALEEHHRRRSSHSPSPSRETKRARTDENCNT